MKYHNISYHTKHIRKKQHFYFAIMAFADKLKLMKGAGLSNSYIEQDGYG